jgi:nucleotide-binding universal stress UspA family protein
VTVLRRILVAVDAGPPSLAALAAAARLGGEIEAVHVRDANLLRLVDHPFIHTVSLSAVTGGIRDEGVLEKALELQAVAARRAVERVAAEHGVRAGFTLRNGLVAAELAAAARGVDLLCIGWSGRAGAASRLGSVARALLHAPPAPMMVVRRPPAGQVTALWDGSDASRRAHELAVALASGGEVVLLETPAAINRLRPDGLLVAAVRSGLRTDAVPCSLVVVP